MPDASISSTESTFGTISGTFTADQSTISGTVYAVTGTVDGSVGVPGPQGQQGPQGIQGPPGPPGEGGTWGSIVGTLSNQTDLQNALDAKQNVSGMTAYLTKAGNLTGLTDLAAARDNLQLGVLYSPTFAGLTVQGSGANVANLTPTSLSLNHATSGSFVIQPSSGITFPDTTIQTTAFNATAMLPYALIDSQVFTGTPSLPAGTIGVTAALGDNDTSLATTAFVQQELLSGTANAKNLEVYVRNQTGSTLAAGAIVYVNGATGNRPTVTLAQANNDANSAQTMGFVKTAIANNGFGYVIVRGECENLDTSAVAEGTQLYLSPTVAGAYTTTKPSAPQHLVYVGIVIRSHPTQGVILVAVQNGYELDELHDVSITSPTNGQVLKYNSTTGLWYNGTDVGGVAWGGITGTLSNQTDLQTALDGKYSTTNPAGYITSSALTGYATETFVTSQGYITSAALSPYLTSATAASTYQTLSGMSSYLTTSAAASTYLTQANAASTYYLQTNPAGYITSSALSPYLTSATAASTYQTLSGMSSYLTTASAASTYAPIASPTFTGLATFDNPGNYAISVPASGVGYDIRIEGQLFTMRNASAEVIRISPGGIKYPDGVTQSVAYPGPSGFLLKADNLSGLANTGTARTNLGLGTMATETASNYLTTATAASTYYLQTNPAGYITSSALSPYLTSATAASTYFTIASAASKADLASPTFTGVPAAPTASPGTNTTQIATTAFVTAAVSASTGATWGSITGTLSSQTDLQSALDAKLSTATAASTYQTLSGMSSYLTTSSAASTYQTISGMSSYLTTATAASTYAPLASPALTGNPTAPTPATADNDTSIATTAFVKAQGYLTSAPVTSVAGKTGAVTLVVGDVSGAAPLASPALTGTPTSPTAAVDTNTTQIATTAYVVGQGYLKSATAASTYQTISGMSSYLTTATAASTYQTISGMSSYLTTASATSTYAPLASPTFTGTVTIPSGASISGYATTASLASYAPLASPALTGTPTAPTASAGTSTTQLATTAFVTTADNLKANLASPAFTGTPTAPTATAGTNTTQIATTAFVASAIPTNNVKAWVNFNGGGTPSIRASMNVSSITDNAVGDFTVNMTTALADANFSMVGNCSIDSSITGFAWVVAFGKSTTPFYEAPTTTTARFATTYSSNVNLRLDPVYCNIAILR